MGLGAGLHAMSGDVSSQPSITSRHTLRIGKV